jgi:hypothetical protein
MYDLYATERQAVNENSVIMRPEKNTELPLKVVRSVQPANVASDDTVR